MGCESSTANDQNTQKQQLKLLNIPLESNYYIYRIDYL